jgi:hypothetical protein
MPPDTRLTPTQLQRFFTPWYYAPIQMVWDGKYVSIQPSAAAASTGPAPTSTPRLTPAATPKPTPAATVEPGATSVSGASSSPGQSLTAVAARSTSLSAGPTPTAPTPASNRSPVQDLAAAALNPAGVVPLVAVGLLAVVVVAVLAGRRRVRRD